MCGIYGVASADTKDTVLQRNFSSLGRALEHRGPDSKSEIENNLFRIGFTRLSIVDVLNGSQPFYSNDTEIIVTANGEIYNYLELRDELIAAGVNFRSTSDIEIVPHLYQMYGDDFILKLRGMFAISIVDIKKSQLKIFVDRLGEKPVYWSLTESYFVYSSELVPLIESNFVEMKIDSDQIPSYIKYGFTLDPFTIIRNVFRIPGGSILTVSLKELSVSQKKYWNLKDSSSTILNPLSKMRSELKVIGENICQGEVNIAVALSSGFDSKVVATIAKEGSNSLHSFTVGYDEDTIHDETVGAQKTADELQISHSSISLSAERAAKDLIYLCSIIDEPIADVSGVNYLALFREAKEQNFKVVLMGQGADEIFGGYEWMSLAVKRARLRAATLSGEFSILEYLKLSIYSFSIEGGTVAKINSLLGSLYILKQVYFDLRDKINGRYEIDFYKLAWHLEKCSKMADRLQTVGRSKKSNYRVYKFSNSSNFTELSQDQLLADYLRVNGFLQLDKISMSQSVEVRNPLADFKLLQIARVTNWVEKSMPKKSLLKASFMSLSNLEVNSKKLGFSPPTRIWFREIMKSYKNELNNPRIVELGIIPKEWNKYFRRPFEKSGRKSDFWFRLVFLELWVRSIEEKVNKSF